MLASMGSRSTDRRQRKYCIATECNSLSSMQAAALQSVFSMQAAALLSVFSMQAALQAELHCDAPI